MLAAAQKAAILRRSGIAVPAAPVEAVALDGAEAQTQPQAQAAGRADEGAQEAARESALGEWTAKINALFVAYVAARAAKSLREAEAARQLDELRRMSSVQGWTRAPSHRA